MKKKKKEIFINIMNTQWVAPFSSRSWTETTLHLGSTRCTNIFLVKVIGGTSKEHKKIDPTQQLLNTQHGSKPQAE